MMEKTNKTWYVARRGELLAEQFLLDLEPDQLSYMEGPDIGFDYMAFFSKSDGTLIAIAVEVKATQQDIRERYFLGASQVRRLQNSNMPVLIIVVDVKHNDIYFNWIHDAIPIKYVKSSKTPLTIPIKLRKSTPEEVKKLKQEILEK